MDVALWSASPDGHFDCRLWEDGAIVRLHESGETHSLSESATAVLAMMFEQPNVPRSCGDWLQALSKEASVDDAEWQDDLAALAALLFDLERMSLVQRHAR